MPNSSAVQTYRWNQTDELRLLQDALHAGEVTAFVGAGVSAELYPLWGALQQRFIEAARREEALSDDELAFVAELAGRQPQLAVTLIRKFLGDPAYFDILTNAYAPGAKGSAHYSRAHERLLQLPFRGYVTTNYDESLAAARSAVCPSAGHKPVFTWKDEHGLHAWRSGQVFQQDEKPILHIHGHTTAPETVILCETSYATSYGSPGSSLPSFVEHLYSERRLLFVGFGFADPWQDFLFKTYAMRIPLGGSGAQLRHFALIGLDENDGTSRLRRRMLRDVYKIIPIFYPIRKVMRDGRQETDHSELLNLLELLRTRDVPPAGQKPQATPPTTIVATPADGRFPLTFSVLPAGTFNVIDNAGARRTIRIAKPFGLAQTVVTAGLYREFAQRTGANIPFDDSRADELPATGLTWSYAVAVAQWLARETGYGIRLPSEAEWEYGARAGSAGDFWFGTLPAPQHLACRDGAQVGLWPAASGQPNPWGLYHVHGNAWEWVADSGAGTARNLPQDASADMGDPNFRVLKGGGFTESAIQCCASARRRTTCDTSKNTFGVRLALTLP